ncbi:MAG: iron-containing alcohol dehydrogenase [Alphaproteobacteria bacterium]
MVQINYLTMIEFAAGALATLERTLIELGLSRPLLVTDRGIVEAGLARRTVAAMAAISPAATFDATPPNPTENAVAAATALFCDARCDGIVALGGGSPLDLAKAVALMATHAGPLGAFAPSARGAAVITAQTAPVIAIPTTAGTGSEVGRAALIVMSDGRKLGFISPHLLPKRAICDPELTVGLPPGLTAATGMDAIAHCIETYLSPAINPPADAIALDGLRRAWAHIESAVADGSNMDARWNMMMASVQGGLCFQKGLGAVHALSHPLGALTNPVLHHGTLNAVLLPAVLRFNAQGQDDKYAALRDAMGLETATTPADAIGDLNQRVGIPPGLSAMGVPRQALSAIAHAGMADPCTQSNPRPPTGADYERILADSW